MENKIILTSQEEVKDEYELATLLRHIASLIENGNGSAYQQGFYPHWTLQVKYVEQEELENQK